MSDTARERGQAVYKKLFGEERESLSLTTQPSMTLPLNAYLLMCGVARICK